MTNQILIDIIIFVIAVTMTMVGKGGGNFYILILAMANIPMHEAAATGQFILFSASLTAMFFFHKNKSVSWKLALVTGSLTALSAFGGGVLSHLFSGLTLKLIFASMLFIAGAVMLLPVSEKKHCPGKRSFFTLSFESDGETYGINLLIVIPVTVVIGFASGLVGVSGGSFLVPLMVLAAGVSMHTAVGTASILIALTAFMGFMGHAIQGDFNPLRAVPLAVVTMIGGILGSKLALKSKPKNLKRLFAYTNWLAAVMMIINITVS